jgi:transposase
MTSSALSPSPALAAGIDAGQRFLDVGLAPSGKTFRMPNAAEGIATIVDRLAQQGVRRVVLEAIGPYAQRLVAALSVAGFEVGIVNPRRIKAFRDAEGRRAKTDRLDARLIARFALAMTDAIRPLPSAEQLTLKALSTRRRQLTEMIAMEKTRLKQATEPLLQDSHRTVIAGLTAQCASIEAELARHVARDPERARVLDILKSIPGIGERVATVPSPICPNSAGPIARPSPAWPGLRRTSASPATRRHGRPSPADGPACARRSTWPPLSPAATIRR